MLRIVSALLLFLFFLTSRGQQELRLPSDFRQHNLTTYNASLFNPVFSLDRNNPQSIALWTRWQSQNIDGSPSTIFLNYTRGLNKKSAAGAAFFQHNTGIYFNSGGVLNYAYAIRIKPNIKLAFGANIFGFKQTLADDRFQVDPDLPLPIDTATDDFILQMAPGASLTVERLTLSLGSENLIDYNFTEKESNTEKGDKIFMSLLSYDFPINLGSVPNTFLRPSIYLRTVPDQSNQIGFYTLLNSDKYWGQLGYNNFFGYGVGVGGTFFKRMSVGATVEFGTNASISKETSFELMAAYFLGNPEERHKIVGSDDEEENELLDIEEEKALEEKQQEEKVKEELKEAEEIAAEEKAKKKAAEKEAKEEAKQQRKLNKVRQDSIAQVEKEAVVAAKEQQKQLEKEAREQAKKEKALSETKKKEEKTAEEIAVEEKTEQEARREEEARKLDSINSIKKVEALAEAEKAAQKRKQDSLIAAAQEARRKATLAAKKKAEAEKAIVQKEVDTPVEGEKYEEVNTEDGLTPGFYLIANVFGTKKYLDAFMADLRKRGMQPKSFLRDNNNYNYVYLKRYDTMEAARAARDNNFEGRYPDKTWIFRVVSE